jgi:soluble lytic murein transglycosylase-like protein
MQRSNLAGEVRTVLRWPTVVVGVCVSTFVCLNGVSAREHRDHKFSHARYELSHARSRHEFSHARYAAHHLMPMQVSNAGFGFGSFGQSYGGQSTPAATGYSGMAAAQASAAGVPVSLVDRVIRRESGGNARAVHAGNYGLMQIKLGTARAMGYTGSAAGLLDPQTNMTYAVRYLAGAYRAAGGNESRAVALYASGYYAQAKARGFSPYATAAPWTSGFGAPIYTPVGFATPGFASGAPVLRVRHLRHHAV